MESFLEDLRKIAAKARDSLAPDADGIAGIQAKLDDLIQAGVIRVIWWICLRFVDTMCVLCGESSVRRGCLLLDYDC